MTAYDPAKHHRHSIRLQGYDYSQAGAYFVTLCVQNRECALGDLVGDRVHLTASGSMVVESWLWLADQYPRVDLDASIVMPNHLHGIIVIGEAKDTGEPKDTEGGSRTAPTLMGRGSKPKELGRLVGAFKTVSTKHINKLRGSPGLPFWQRNFYEHVIRDEVSLDRIRRYIVNNPARWSMDPENPAIESRPANTLRSKGRGGS